MRLSIMVTSSILLMVGCQDTTQAPVAKGPSPAQPSPAQPSPPVAAPSKNRQPDSPIVITDASSINYRKHNDFYIRSPKEAVAQLDKDFRYYLRVPSCSEGGSCSVLLDETRWTIELFDSRKQKVATIKYPDGNDKEFVEFKIIGSGTFKPEHLLKHQPQYPDEDYPDGAPGIEQLTDRVASAEYAGRPLTCTATPCQIFISKRPTNP